MLQCGIQSRKIVCGQARRTEPSSLQFTEHLARIFIDQNHFFLKFHTPSHSIETVRGVLAFPSKSTKLTTRLRITK